MTEFGGGIPSVGIDAYIPKKTFEVYEDPSNPPAGSGKASASSSPSRKATAFFPAPKYPLGDSRIWTPDETCFPFLVETQRMLDNAGGICLCRFTVPSDLLAIVSSVSTVSEASFSSDKDQFCFQLRRQRSPTNLTPDNGVPIPTHGALANVEELTDGGNFPGFAIPFGSFTRQIRLVLQPCSYEGIVNNIVGSSFTISLSGWTFRRFPL